MSILQGVKDKIIVEILEKENKSEGGIFLPETAQLEPQMYGKVISIGEDVGEISVDDVLAFNERAGMDLTFEQKKMKCIKEDEVYAILKE